MACTKLPILGFFGYGLDDGTLCRLSSPTPGPVGVELLVKTVKTGRRHIIGDNSGWINIKLEPSGRIIALPEYLKVELIKTKDGRDYFTILEGVHKGKSASIIQTGGKSNLGMTAAYSEKAQLIFNISKQEVSFGASKIVKAITDSRNPIPKGKHNIQLPDFPHEIGRGYLDKSSYSLSWFYLGVGNAVAGSNDRYLHTGSVSAGCVTVEPASWDELYKYLILSRQGDDTNVGIITVT